jgi:hypothetical protein
MNNIHRYGTLNSFYDRNHTVESKLLISLHHKPCFGKDNPFYGKNHTEEAKLKNRLAHLGKKASTATKLKMKLSHSGSKNHFYKKHHTEEAKQKNRQAHLGRILPKEIVKKCLQRRIPSSLEIKMVQIIKKFNLPYKFVGDGKFFIENKCPDFVNTNGKKIALEVFYRKHKNKFRGNNNDWKNVDDWKQKRQEIFDRYGWKIEFFDETQVNENEIIRRID